MFLEEKRISSIKYIGKSRVINLNVKKNHNFITKNGIPTHNSDYLSLNAQAMLRDLMEQVQDITRFIFCCNYGHKMIPELLSRCQVVELNNPPLKEIGKFILNIIKKEKIKVANNDEIISLIKTYYPDIRRIVNTLQYNIVNGAINHIKMDNVNSVHDEILKAMKNGDINEIRKILRSNSIIYTELYQYLFESVGDFNDPGNAIILIGEHLYRDAICAIKEINFVTMVVKMMRDKIVAN